MTPAGLSKWKIRKWFPEAGSGKNAAGPPDLEADFSGENDLRELRGSEDVHFQKQIGEGSPQVATSRDMVAQFEPAADGPSWTKRVTWSFIKIMKLLGRSAHILNAAVTPRCWRDRLSSQIRVPAPRRAARFSIKLRTSSMRLAEWPRLKPRTVAAANSSTLLLDPRGSQGNGLMETVRCNGPLHLFWESAALAGRLDC